MDARDRRNTRYPAPSPHDHLSLDLLAQDRVGAADVVFALGRDRCCLYPVAGLDQRACGRQHDLVVRPAPVLEREVVVLELEVEPADLGSSSRMRLLEQLLAGLVAFEDDDPGRSIRH